MKNNNKTEANSIEQMSFKIRSRPHALKHCFFKKENTTVQVAGKQKKVVHEIKFGDVGVI